MKNLSISRRLTLGFLVVVLCMVGLTATGVWRVETINSHLTTINDLNSVKQRYAINFRGSVHDRAIALRDVVLSTTPAEVRVEIDTIDTLAANYVASAGPITDRAGPCRPAEPRRVVAERRATGTDGADSGE